MAGDDHMSRPLLFVWQRDILCEKLTQPQLKQMDNNVYVRNNDHPTFPAILWSPVKNDSCIIGFEDPSELNKMLPEFDANSQLFRNYQVFKSYEMKNFQVIPQFPGAGKGAVLPENIKTLLNRQKKDVPFIGAYSL
jgi:hypothetical protein